MQENLGSILSSERASGDGNDLLTPVDFLFGEFYIEGGSGGYEVHDCKEFGHKSSKFNI